MCPERAVLHFSLSAERLALIAYRYRLALTASLSVEHEHVSRACCFRNSAWR